MLVALVVMGAVIVALFVALVRLRGDVNFLESNRSRMYREIELHEKTYHKYEPKVLTRVHGIGSCGFCGSTVVTGASTPTPYSHGDPGPARCVGCGAVAVNEIKMRDRHRPENPR